jgi:hypothetical protein
MTDENRSIASLIGDLTEQGSTLVRTEARLLRVEMGEKLSKFGTSAIEVLAGAICLLAALLVLLQALVIALANTGLGGGWASLIVGVVVAVLGLILVRTGRAGLDPGNLEPEKTKRQFERDVSTVKEQVK